jgi:hypothetical protein
VHFPNEIVTINAKLKIKAEERGDARPGLWTTNAEEMRDVLVFL